MPVNRACEVLRDVRRQLLLDARRGVGERPADGEARSSAMPGQRVVLSRASAGAARAPKPVGPAVHSKLSSGESPTEAMSRWAHGTSPAKCWRNRAAVIAPGAAGGVVGVGDLGGELAPRSRRPAGTATAARPTASPAARRARRRGPRRWRSSPPTRWPSATFIAPVRVATSTSDVGLELGDGVRHRVGEHQPALGVGVGDLAGAAAVVADHVAGAHRVAADGVLGGGHQADRPAPGSRPRPARPCTAMTTAPPVMSRFMVIIASAGLDRQAAGVEGDALADQHDRGRTPARRWAARSRAGSAAAGWPRPGRRRGCRRSPRAASSRLVPDRDARGRPRRRPAAACSASQAGFLRFDGHRGQRPGAPAGAAQRRWRARSSASALRRRRRARPAPPAPPACSRGPSERQWKPKEPSIAPTTKASRPRRAATGGDRGGDAVAVPGGAGRARRRRGAGRSGAARRHRPGAPRRSASPAPPTDRERGDLAGLAGRPGRLEDGEQVEPERVGRSSSAPGPSRTAVRRPGEHREAPRTSTPPSCVRQQRR